MFLTDETNMTFSKYINLIYWLNGTALLCIVAFVSVITWVG